MRLRVRWRLLRRHRGGPGGGAGRRSGADRRGDGAGRAQGGTGVRTADHDQAPGHAAGGAVTVDGALARVIRSAADRAATAEPEVCELCAARVTEEHAHLYDTAAA